MKYKNMPSLPLVRFKQDPGHCSIAACACLTNYYNPQVDYEYTKTLASKIFHAKLSEGLTSGQIGCLLNALGFKKVTIYTCDLKDYDFAWVNYSSRKKIKAIDRMLKSHSIESDVRETIKDIKVFLQSEFDNRLEIDIYFARQIQKAIDRGLPVVMGFNWNMFFRQPKYNSEGKPDYIKGSEELHGVVVCGYDKNGISIIDSHDKYYKGKLKQFASGRYVMGWEELVVVGNGDILVPECYDKKALIEI